MTNIQTLIKQFNECGTQSAEIVKKLKRHFSNIFDGKFEKFLSELTSYKNDEVENLLHSFDGNFYFKNRDSFNGTNEIQIIKSNNEKFTISLNKHQYRCSNQEWDNLLELKSDILSYRNNDENLYSDKKGFLQHKIITAMKELAKKDLEDLNKEDIKFIIKLVHGKGMFPIIKANRPIERDILLQYKLFYDIQVYTQLLINLSNNEKTEQSITISKQANKFARMSIFLAIGLSLINTMIQLYSEEIKYKLNEIYVLINHAFDNFPF